MRLVPLSRVYKVMMPRLMFAIRKITLKRFIDYDREVIERVFISSGMRNYEPMKEELMDSQVSSDNGPELGVFSLRFDPVKMFHPNTGLGMTVGQYLGYEIERKGDEEVCKARITSLIWVKEERGNPGRYTINENVLPPYLPGNIELIFADKEKVIEIMRLFLSLFKSRLDNIEGAFVLARYLDD